MSKILQFKKVSKCSRCDNTVNSDEFVVYQSISDDSTICEKCFEESCDEYAYEEDEKRQQLEGEENE